MAGSRLPPFQTLQSIHAELQMGTYLSGVAELDDGLRFLSSAKIPDTDWNYAYGLSADRSEALRQVRLVADHASELDRPAVVYVDDPEIATVVVRDGGGRLVNQETWMVFRARSSVSVARPVSPAYGQRPTDGESDMDAFLGVFSAAFGGDEANGSDASGLLAAYLDSLSTAEPGMGTKVRHILGRMEGEPVSIGSAYMNSDGCALYNIGTVPRARRMGLASAVTVAAVEMAREFGAEPVFLQADTDSAAERLYRGLGFVPACTCSVIDVGG